MFGVAVDHRVATAVARATDLWRAGAAGRGARVQRADRAVADAATGTGGCVSERGGMGRVGVPGGDDHWAGSRRNRLRAERRGFWRVRDVGVYVRDGDCGTVGDACAHGADGVACDVV